MDGPVPDPSTLDDGDDDVVSVSGNSSALVSPPLTCQPLAVVQEKAKSERSASQRTSFAQPAAHRQQASIDLFADDPPARPSTTEPTPRAPPRQAQPAQPKTQKPGDSLLGLDFFGSAQPTGGSRPSSTVSTPTAPAGMSRPDLKQSILSLYSKPQPAPAPTQHERTNSFGDMASPTGPSTSSNMGGLTDAFSGLSFPSTTSPPAKPADKPSPFANLTSFGNAKSTAAAPKVTSPSGSASGSFFDSLSSPSMPAQKSQSRTPSISSNGQDFFGGFTSPTVKPSRPNPPSSSLSNDLFGLSSPAPAPAASMSPPMPTVSSPQQEMSSAFNLSSPSFQPQPSAPAKPEFPVATAAAANMMSANLDPWGGNAWSTPDPAPEPARPGPSNVSSAMKVPDTLTANDIGHGWGAPKPTPTVAADEDFGGWTSAAPVTSGTTTTTTSSGKPTGGFGGADDLFSNVWE